MHRGIPTLIVLTILAGALALWAWSLRETAVPTPADAAATSPTSTPTPSDQLTVMTANVRINEPGDGINAWPHRRELLVKVLLQQNPDILGCQEVTPAQGAYLIKELGTSYGYFPRPGVGKVEGANNSKTGQLLGAVTASFASLNTLFYRSDRFEQIDGEVGLAVPGELQSNPSENTFFTLAVLKEKGTGRHLVVIDTHLRHQNDFAVQCALALRQRLAETLKKYPDAQPLIMGDMNHDKTQAPWRALTGVPGAIDGLGVLTDSFHYADKRPGESWGNWHEFTGIPRGEWPSDLILSGPGLVSHGAHLVRDGGNHGVWPSDHFPVITTFTWK